MYTKFMKKQSLSVVVSVRNGERWLDACLSSVKAIADEIIVVDHESIDKTLFIAKKFTKKIYQQKNDFEQIDVQKNYGFEKATSDWIISLDADEEITPELAKEINATINHQSSISNAYWIPRKNIIFGKWIEHTGWYPDEQLRLFRKGKAVYASFHVHEHLQVTGEVGHLVGHILHHNYDTVSQFFQRSLFSYAPNEAESRIKSGYVFSYSDAIQMPFQEFLSRYFAREGYKDGFYGLVLSLLMATYHFAVFMYIWEKQGFVDGASPHLLASQFETTKHDLKFWLNKKQSNEEKNIIEKTFTKLKNKFHV